MDLSFSVLLWLPTEAKRFGVIQKQQLSLLCCTHLYLYLDIECIWIKYSRNYLGFFTVCLSLIRELYKTE